MTLLPSPCPPRKCISRAFRSHYVVGGFRVHSGGGGVWFGEGGLSLSLSLSSIILTEQRQNETINRFPTTLSLEVWRKQNKTLINGSINNLNIWLNILTSIMRENFAIHLFLFWHFFRACCHYCFISLFPLLLYQLVVLFKEAFLA